MDIEDDFNSDLGIKIEPTANGALNKTHKKEDLSLKVLKMSKMKHCNPVKTPMSQVGVGSELGGE